MYKKLEVKYKRPSLKITDFWESTLNKLAHFTNYIKFIVSNLGDFTWFIQVDSIKKKNQALKTTQKYYV